MVETAAVVGEMTIRRSQTVLSPPLPFRPFPCSSTSWLTRKEGGLGLRRTNTRLQVRQRGDAAVCRPFLTRHPFAFPPTRLVVLNGRRASVARESRRLGRQIKMPFSLVRAVLCLRYMPSDKRAVAPRSFPRTREPTPFGDQHALPIVPALSTFPARTIGQVLWTRLCIFVVFISMCVRSPTLVRIFGRHSRCSCSATTK